MTTHPAFNGFEPPTQNWSKLPHALIDNLDQFTSLSELKTVLYILRHTWGFSEFDKPKKITTDEFRYGRKHGDGTRIDNGTGMTPAAIRSGLTRAVEHGFIAVDEDKRDKARKKKYYAINMTNQKPMVENLPSGQRKSTIGATKVNHRTEKETIGRNNSKNKNYADDANASPPPPAGKPKKKRKRDPVFDAVAHQLFKVAEGDTAPSAIGGRVGKVIKALREIDVTLDEFNSACKWWKRTKEIDLPKDDAKAQGMMLEYRALNAKRQATMEAFENTTFVAPSLTPTAPTYTNPDMRKVPA